MAIPSIRQLAPDDWAILKRVRLKALRTDPGVFSSNLAKESAMTEADWRGWLADDERGGVFVLFAGSDPIGMTGIAVWLQDTAGESAILWGSWIEPAWRGKGLSELFYTSRLGWARRHEMVRRIVVSHREDNEASRRANQRHGFVFTHKDHRTWPDGVIAHDMHYELRLNK